jgi:hypothetical protein
MGGMALAVAVQSKPEETQALYMTAFGLGAQYGVLLPTAARRRARPTTSA